MKTLGELGARVQLLEGLLKNHELSQQARLEFATIRLHLARAVKEESGVSLQEACAVFADQPLGAPIQGPLNELLGWDQKYILNFV